MKMKNFKPILISEFSDKVDGPEKARCLEIAEWLGEPLMNFILSSLDDKRCGINGIEHVYSMTKDADRLGKIKTTRAKFFNYYITLLYKKRDEL